MTQDASSNKIDSHIQMPKCILKRFENPTQIASASWTPAR